MVRVVAMPDFECRVKGCDGVDVCRDVMVLVMVVDTNMVLAVKRGMVVVQAKEWWWC